MIHQTGRQITIVALVRDTSERPWSVLVLGVWSGAAFIAAEFVPTHVSPLSVRTLCVFPRTSLNLFVRYIAAYTQPVRYRGRFEMHGGSNSETPARMCKPHGCHVPVSQCSSARLYFNIYFH